MGDISTGGGRYHEEEEWEKREKFLSNNLHAGRPFDQLDLVAIRSIDKYELAAGGCLRGTIGDRNPFRFELRDGVVEIVYLEREVNEVLLDFHRPTGWKTAKFNEFVAVGDFQEGQMGPARGRLALNDFQPKHVAVKLDRLVHVADTHSCVEELLDLHGDHYKRLAFGNQ